MFIRPTIYLLLINMCCISTITAQVTSNPPNKEFAYNTNVWMMYNGTHKLSAKWKWYTEVQWRKNEWLKNPLQLQLRTTFDYKAGEKITTSLGYVWTETDPYGNQPSSNYDFGEHRPFEQIVIDNKLGRFNISHRYRFEQRFSETKIYSASDSAYFHDSWSYKNRFRYRFQVNIPLNKKEIENKTLFLTVYDELFISFGKNVKKNMFDQNRIFVGLGYKVNSALGFQVGYVLQSILKSDGFKFEQNHTAVIGITYNIDLTKLGKKD